MRGVDLIRVDGVAPIPVADARQQAHKSEPKARRPHLSISEAPTHQPKNARGLGRSPIAEGDVPLSCFIYKRVIVTDGSLVAADRTRDKDSKSIQQTRALLDTHDQRGRKKGCGAWTVRGDSFDAKSIRFHRLHCKCWDCHYCGPRRAKRYRRGIAAWAQKLKLNRFVTLTLDPKKLNGEDSTKYLNRTFAKLRTLLHREFGKSLSYIRVLEYQANGTAHFHLLLNRFVPQDWLKKNWQAVGGGWHVDIRLVELQRIVGYVSKYLSKDLLLSAPKGSRRVTSSRDIQLFEKPVKDALWSLLKTSIDYIRTRFVMVASETLCDTDGSLNSFVVISNLG